MGTCGACAGVGEGYVARVRGACWCVCVVPVACCVFACLRLRMCGCVSVLACLRWAFVMRNHHYNWECCV